MADQETIDEILDHEYTPENEQLATKLLASCTYTTTAVIALAAALDNAGLSDQATYLRECADELAAIEADEI
jgi:hypothetical protein